MWHLPAMLKRRFVIAAAVALPVASRAQGVGFDRFVEGVMAEARRAGIRDATLRVAFADVGPNQRVSELDR